MNENQNPKKSLSSIIKSKEGIIAIIIIALILVGFGGYLVYQMYKNSTSSSDIPTLAELKEKAAKKYETLQGVSFQEENSVRDSINSLVSPSEGSFLTADQTNPSSRIIVEEGARKIADKKTNQNSDVYFTELEFIVNDKSNDLISDGFYPSLNQGNPLIDLAKPFTIKSWNSSCSSKFVITQNGKTAVFTNSTRNYNTNYLGGKYAVKAVYEDADLGFGCFDTFFIGSPDLEFVKAILSENGNFKQVGTDVIDGVKVVIYENDFSISKPIPMRDLPADVNMPEEITSTPETKVKYYVDVKDLRVMRTQYFSDNKLVSTQNLKSNRNLGKDGNKEIESTSELSGVDIKEAKLKLSVSSISESKLTDAIKQFALLYPNTADESIRYVYIYPEEPVDEYSKLTQTKDYDPNWDEVLRSREKSISYSATYSGESYSMTVYKQDPYKERSDTTVTNKDITIDGKKVTGKLIEFKNKLLDPGFSNDPNGTMPIEDIAPANFSTLSFSHQGKFYVMTFFGYGSSRIDPSSEAINLISLTQSKAQQIDSRNEFIKNSQPNVKYSYSLTDVSSNSRYLPGDLSKEYNLNASFLFVDGTPNKPSTCVELKSGERLYSMSQCLLDNFNGFQLTYYPETIKIIEPDRNEGGETSSSFPGFAGGYGTNYYVFKAKYSEVQPFLKDLSSAFTNPSGVNGGYDYLEKDGFTFIFEAPELSSEQRDKILRQVALDRDLATLDKQISANQKPIPLDY